MTSLDDDQLAGLVRATLVAQADRLTVPPRPFEPPSDDAISGIGQAPARAGSRSRRLVAAAAVLVLAVSGIGVAIARDGHSSPTTRVTATTPVVGPEVPGALAPSSGPPGMALWMVRWERTPSLDVNALRTQLFRSDNGDEWVLVVIWPKENLAPSGHRLTVRGRPGDLRPFQSGPPSSRMITWEDGLTMTAAFRGMTMAGAISILSSLTYRSATDHQRGFAPSSARGFRLLGEATYTDRPVDHAEFAYADNPGSGIVLGGRYVWLDTLSAVGQLTNQYLTTWFNGARMTPGGVVSTNSPAHTLARVWPDGRSESVDARGTNAASASRLAQILDGIRPRTGAEMLALRTQVEDRVAQLPMLGTARVGDATIVLRGDNRQPSICVLAWSQRRCVAAAGETGLISTHPADIAAFDDSALIDGHWYVVVVGTPGTGIVAPRQPHSASLLPTLVPYPSATIGHWHVVVAELPAGQQTVLVGTATGQTRDRRPKF